MPELAEALHKMPLHAAALTGAAGGRAARGLEFTVLSRRGARSKHECRAVQLVFQPGGDDAHHAFMKIRIEHA